MMIVNFHSKLKFLPNAGIWPEVLALIWNNNNNNKNNKKQKMNHFSSNFTDIYNIILGTTISYSNFSTDFSFTLILYEIFKCILFNVSFCHWKHLKTKTAQYH